MSNLSINDRICNHNSPTHTVTRRIGELGIDPGYYNEATNGIMAGWCEINLPDECYSVENSNDPKNCICHLLDADGEDCTGDCGIEFQRALDWDDNDEISVDVPGDADESDIEDALHEAAINHIYEADVREDEADNIIQLARRNCGITGYWYAIQAGNSGEWDGDGSWWRDRALGLLSAAHDEWEREDGDPENEPQIAVIDNAMTNPFCESIIHYNDINWVD